MLFTLRFLGCKDEVLVLVSSMDSAIDMVDSNSLAFVSGLLLLSLNDKLPESWLRDTTVPTLWSLIFEFTQTWRSYTIKIAYNMILVNKVVIRFLYFYTLQAIEQKRWGSCICLPHSSQGLLDFLFGDLVSTDWPHEFIWTASLPFTLYGCRIKQMGLQVMRQRDGIP